MKVLLTGASSFLGWNICEAANEQLTIHGLVYQHTSNREDITEHRVDLTDFQAVDQIIEQIHPDAILHAAAFSKPDLCEQDPSASHQLNVEVTLHLAHHAKSRDIPLIFTSTDLVFNGLKGDYSEMDETNPVSVYGKHKVMAEELIGEVHPGAIICRCPLMYGYSDTDNESYLSGMLDRLDANDPIQLFTDEFRSQAHGLDVAQGILTLLRNKCKGIYHLGGPECISRYDFGMLVADQFGKTQASIIPALQQDVQSVPPRPPDVSMNISKAKAEGYHPKPPVDGLKAVMKLIRKYAQPGHSAGYST